jgi:hypothetical protein
VWDINDPFIGRVQFEAPAGGLLPGVSYALSFTGTLPPAKPGAYRVIVRTDIFNEVYEGLNESNNRTPSAETMELTVDALQLGVPLATTLSTGQSRLFEVSVGLGETLVLSVRSESGGANEIFARFDDVPTSIVFDAGYEGPLAPDQFAVVPSTQPGKYYVLVRGHSQPAANTPATVLARVLPFGIIDVVPDVGGDSKYVTTTILGAQFKDGAVVKLVRPGIHEVQPVKLRSRRQHEDRGDLRPDGRAARPVRRGGDEPQRRHGDGAVPLPGRARVGAGRDRRPGRAARVGAGADGVLRRVRPESRRTSIRPTRGSRSARRNWARTGWCSACRTSCSPRTCAAGRRVRPMVRWPACRSRRWCRT